MYPILWRLAVVCTPFVMAIRATGLVLRLTEWSWNVPAGANGSRGLLLVSAVLCLPVAAYLGPAVLARLTGAL